MSYYIEIDANGIIHKQVVESVDDIEILDAVLVKIKRDACKEVLANEKEQNPDIKKTNQ